MEAMTQTKTLHCDSGLPVPDQDALHQSEKLVSLIKETMAEQGGVIGFDQYMKLALYEPGLGYYSAGSRKFGPDGDFVTAPEISPLFSQCLARQCEQVLSELDTGVIMELGAGTGIMARDLLLELEKLNALPEKYFILEVSADLKQRQQALINQSIPHLVDRVVWLDALPEQALSGLILANEIIDALPVRRFKKTAAMFKELKVGLVNDALSWNDEDAEEDLAKALQQIEHALSKPFPEGYISEINMDLEQWLSALAATLEYGVMIFIDYGYSAAEYYHPERADGSLLCHYRHRVHADPFYYPGLQDITTSVNFTAVAECADTVGLHVNGYTNQTYFLFGCGLDHLAADMQTLDIKSQTKMAQQVRVLTMPEEMGERFKVIALTKNYNNAMLGFSIMDQRGRL
jgi:SAM-dependent MidA family methyltransferase